MVAGRSAPARIGATSVGRPGPNLASASSRRVDACRSSTARCRSCLSKETEYAPPADWPGQTVAGTRSMREQRLRSRCGWWACRCPKYRLKRWPKEVQGRRILGKTADGDFEAAAAAQTCALAVLKPGAIATASPNLSANPMASSNPSANASAGTSGTGMPTNRTATGDAVLALNAFPPQSGPANPLAAHTLFLLKDSFDNVLLKSGMRPPAGKTPMQGWDLACQQKSPQCAQALIGLQPFIAAVVKIDPSSGKATFLGVPAGSYYVFSTTHAYFTFLGNEKNGSTSTGTLAALPNDFCNS